MEDFVVGRTQLLSAHTLYIKVAQRFAKTYITACLTLLYPCSAAHTTEQVSVTLASVLDYVPEARPVVRSSVLTLCGEIRAISQHMRIINTLQDTLRCLDELILRYGMKKTLYCLFNDPRATENF